MSTTLIINLAYIASAVLFIFGLKMLSRPDSARKGNMLSSIGMLLAIAATLLTKGLHFEWIVVGVLIGTIVGAFFAYRVQMTQMPEMVALLNGFGGLASLLVGASVYVLKTTDHSTLYKILTNTPIDGFTAISIILAILIGGIAFTGSLIAWGKLKGIITTKPIQFTGQRIFNAALLLLIVIASIILTINPTNVPLFVALVILSLVLGITSVIPIGGADMPVVISLLNSYSGLAACASGFVIQNTMLIVAGALVGASGVILTQIMCKAMNRSLTNVLFSGFGAAKTSSSSKDQQGEVHPISPEDAYLILEAASSVVITPGYGLAVAQAQHVVRELGQILEKNGADVRYAIHPVAGRMPGHMNVLLAEANVPYDQLVEMDAINPTMNMVDVCIVIGANDTVNPAALNDKGSPIYGMPIIETHRAKTVFVIKRSMATGFAGVQNELFFYENTRMIFGDAKAVIQRLIGEFKE